jgi:superfamily II DNA or RNA helicase
MAGDHASPFAPIVVASVATLCRDARLTGFADNHFSLVVTDEAHHSCCNSYEKVISYFHFGAESLAEGWVEPLPGTDFKTKARVLGVTATPEINGARHLSEAFERIAFQYQLLQAVQDGWLVPPVTKNIPLKIDLRGLRPGRTPNGSDFKADDLSEKMVPILESLATQIAELARDRKTMAFTPSVECARILAEAITRNGLNGIFVSGECLDVNEKTEAYRQAGKGTVLCNCALYVEGADFPDTDCVVVARATKSTGFYRQMVGRGTRTLPGIVNGLQTPRERRAAIAASAKPNLLILDPLWISDRIDLCDAYDLFTSKPEVKKMMKEKGEPTAENAKEAERDFIKALEREARKHARKKARTIDPLAWAVSLGDAALASYTPEAGWESAPPSVGQVDFLRKQGMDVSQIKYKGLASKIIGRIMTRIGLKLATPHQLSLMHKLGLDEHTCATLTIREATDVIDKTLKDRSGH